MKILLLRHFEKGLLALAFVFLAAQASALFARPNELELGPKLSETIEAVGQYMEHGGAPELPPVDVTAELRGQLTTPEAVDGFGPWLALRRPNLIYKLPVEPTRPKTEHKPPILSLAVGHESVTISWKSDSPTDVVVTGYVLTRVDDRGARVALLTPESHVVTDETVAACGSYLYRIEEKAEAPADYEPLPSDKVTLAAEAHARVPRDFIVVPDKQLGEKNFQPTVKVFVRRWKNGDWPRKEYWDLQKGDKIGKKEKAADFTTGAEILEIEEAAGVVKVKLRWPSGVVETVTSKDDPEELRKPIPPHKP